MNLSTIPRKISRVFLKNAGFFSKEVQPLYASVVCSMNLTYCIPVLHVILNTTMKPPLLAKKHVSFCNFPLRKLTACSTHNTPTIYGGILKKMQHSCLKSALCFQMISNNPAPYVACFSTCSHCFSMQTLCQKVQCINAVS